MGVIHLLCVPQFAVHLGVARGSSVIILEQTGKNSGYRDRDICGFCPESHCCVDGGPEKLCSVVNMKAVSKALRKAGMEVIHSRDAGRWAFACASVLWTQMLSTVRSHFPSSFQVPVWLCLLLLPVSRAGESSPHPHTHVWQPGLSWQTGTSAADHHSDHAHPAGPPVTHSTRRGAGTFW